MPDQTFNDYFGGQRMTLLAQSAAVRDSIPRVLPDEFYTPGPTKPFDDKVQWPSVTWNRGAATVVNRGSPPRPINIGASAWKYATIFNMKEEYNIDFPFMQALVADYAPVRTNAMAELNRRIIQFNRRFDRTRTQMVHSLFANGVIWIDKNGAILASSSNAVITMDPGIPTGNKITKDGSGSTYNIGDWSSAGTDISGALTALDLFMLQTYGRIPTTLLYGSSLPGWLAKNTALTNYFQRNAGFRDYLVANNDIPRGFLGKTWIPARLAYGVAYSDVNDATGTPTATFASNFIGVLPDLDPDWYEFIEGGTQILSGAGGATQVLPNSTIAQVMNMYTTTYGRYSYGVAQGHPVNNVSMVQGDCAGPVMKETPYMFGTVS